MRITHKPKPEVGDTKVVRKFLWFPKTLTNGGLRIETAWLEFGYIVTEFHRGFGVTGSGVIYHPKPKWRELRWAVQDEINEFNKNAS